MSTNSRSIAGLGEMQNVVVEISQQNLSDQSNITEISNNCSQFRYHKSAHEYFNDNFKNNEFGHACSICDRLWFKKYLMKPSASGNLINPIITDVFWCACKLSYFIVLVLYSGVASAEIAFMRQGLRFIVLSQQEVRSILRYHSHFDETISSMSAIPGLIAYYGLGP